MKLSEKGLGKLYNSNACYYDPDTEEEVVALSYFEHVFEFEPDDFKGMVVLTVEESKRISMFFGAVDCCSSDIKLTESEKNLWKNLNERIEQEEGK